MRLEKKGSRPRVKEGYRSDKKTRGLKKGLEIVRVFNVADVEAMDAKTQGAVVARIGMKKKLAVLKKIQEKEITLLTGNPADEITRLSDKFEQRIQKKKETEKEKQQRQEELEKISEEKEESSQESQTPLKKVKGVGPATIKKLEDAGITSAEELAEMSEDELSEKVDGVSAAKIISAAKKSTEGQDEKEKVLTKAR